MLSVAVFLRAPGNCAELPAQAMFDFDELEVAEVGGQDCLGLLAVEDFCGGSRCMNSFALPL